MIYDMLVEYIYIFKSRTERKGSLRMRHQLLGLCTAYRYRRSPPYVPPFTYGILPCTCAREGVLLISVYIYLVKTRISISFVCLFVCFNPDRSIIGTIYTYSFEYRSLFQWILECRQDTHDWSYKINLFYIFNRLLILEVPAIVCPRSSYIHYIVPTRENERRTVPSCNKSAALSPRAFR